MAYKINDLAGLGRQFNATDIIEVSANGAGSYKVNIGDFTLGGNNYIFVNANGTPVENGQAVRDAYTAAIAMTPNGVAKSATNRVVILLSPGYYNFNENVSGAFTINQSFIDFESLSGVPDVYFTSIQVYSIGSGINVRISGIDTTKNSWLPTGPFVVASEGGVNENIYIKDCVGGKYSFGAFSPGFVGTIDTCVGGDYSFGYTNDFVPVPWIMPLLGTNINNYGTYKNCIGGNFSFLSSQASIGFGIVSNYGTIDNCRAGGQSFVYSQNDSVNQVGTISNCVSTNMTSFCVSTGAFSGAENSGTIFNCRGRDFSFVLVSEITSSATNNGTILNCESTSIDGCFVSNIVNYGGANFGKISNCTAYNSIGAFCGSTGMNQGIISNCISQQQSFCCDTPSGIMNDIYRCTMTGDTFIVGATGGGRVVLGIDTTGVVNY